MAIGLYYGSTDGNTEDIAAVIKEALEEAGAEVDLHNVADDELDGMEAYDKLIFGCPTWDDGELQEDWDAVFADLDAIDLGGKQVAIFGLGDQIGYFDSYQDAIGILGKKARERGAELVGFTPTEGHEFDESKGVEDGMFMGLALDEDNQDDLTEARIGAWVPQVLKAFGM